MAAGGRHAGGEHGRSFTVELISADGVTTELATDVVDLFEAVHLASEWLDGEDPQRDRATSITIFKVFAGERKVVWEYPPARAELPLSGIFGFDPVRWKPELPDFKRERRYPSPPQSRPPEVAVAAAPSQRSEPWRREALAGTGGVPALALSFGALAGAAWADHVSRVLLILAALALWLTVTLTDPAPLLIFAAAAAGLWWRRTTRAAIAQDAADDWE